MEHRIQTQVQEQKIVVEDIVRLNERDLDITADTNLRLKRL